MEVRFLSEMLKWAGLDEAGSGFSGGAGETQMSSFLRDAQAESIVKSGGIGLSEALFKSLVNREITRHEAG